MFRTLPLIFKRFNELCSIWSTSCCSFGVRILTCLLCFGLSAESGCRPAFSVGLREKTHQNTLILVDMRHTTDRGHFKKIENVHKIDSKIWMGQGFHPCHSNWVQLRRKVYVYNKFERKYSISLWDQTSCYEINEMTLFGWNIKAEKWHLPWTKVTMFQES